MNKNSVYETNSFYWDTRGNDFLRAIVLPHYGAFISEEKHQLFGDVSGLKMLEVGCGDGQSLRYHGDHNAGELWGMDISQKQIEKTQQHLRTHGISATLTCSPMEEECGIPTNYFDAVYSIYAIGWTTDLPGTFSRIASYLKKDGIFIFSWSHPIHRCIVEENDRFVLNKPYSDESWYAVSPDSCQGELTLADRQISTYVNALAKAGFVIEQMIEESDEDIMKLHDNSDNLLKRAKMLPITFVIKARKR